MEFELEPESFPDFTGRERELKWLDERLYRRSYSFTPIIVTGVGGVGKTTLLKQWFSTRRISYRPLWIDLRDRFQENIIDELVLQLREPSERHLFDNGITVVLDSADLWSQSQLEEAAGKIFNYKIISSVVVIRRQPVELRRSEQLAVGPLSNSSAGELMRRILDSTLSDDQINQALKAGSGHPLALKLLARLLSGEHIDQVFSSLNSGPLYQLPNNILLPEREIITATKPIIVSAGNRLIKSLQKQPGDLRMIDPRTFEILLADLLTDMGWEVELTKATRDGGADILAYMNTDIGRLLCLVEAKHYREDRKVGVDLVRSLYGTLCDAQANSAMLVTSSSFTRDAREFQQKHHYQLSLREYADVVNWILKFGNNKK